MNVLVLGSGGREHALCYSINKSKRLRNLYAIPGNPGIKTIAECVDLDPMDNEAIKNFVNKKNIDLIIPGSEVYLENGITDVFKGTDVSVFGPTKKATQIESSKEYAKALMKQYNIPTANYEVFDDYENARDYILNNNIPTVIKYDGLAGGKGVVVAMNEKDALDALKLMLQDKKYGDSKVIIEEYLEGPEFSLMCFVNNNIVIPMPIAQDHKRLLDNDKGPNTGGMGVYSSVPIISKEIINEAMNKIMIPTVKAMLDDGNPFTGFLYGGLMLTNSGPKVIEFNARFGDPETEVILPKLETDILDIIRGMLNEKPVMIRWSDDYYVGVVLASKGYPGFYSKGYQIEGLDTTEDIVFHMGTKEVNGLIKTNGGRVLLVTGHANTLKKAKTNAYCNVSKIKCDNLIFRNDIGKKSL
ncbi:Phosphoribosylamine--glycine ligase [Candidatus Izimaplasma bacterium HR1]|jgi:phosphoribosylamine--glycine ligase|uniref:phosphoribosylamine--glycine ligase n=1 Tax=Candidatus Izimoplasma sp. HR1 TaxID=1541959 RepID=UPI0004F83BDD|nr:Phosphoribosylamine--glycine ligase [Candidatus Izimaplasma bacterium HR1]